MDAAITAAAIIPINPGIAREEAKSRIIVFPLSKSRPTVVAVEQYTEQEK